MSQKIPEADYRRVIEQDLAWLDAQPDTLEADHIRQIVKDSVRWYYPRSRTPETAVQPVDPLDPNAGGYNT